MYVLILWRYICGTVTWLCGVALLSTPATFIGIFRLKKQALNASWAATDRVSGGRGPRKAMEDIIRARGRGESFEVAFGIGASRPLGGQKRVMSA